MPAYKDLNGTWYYSHKKRDPITGSWRNIKKRGFKTRREALAAERAVLASGTGAPSQMPFCDVVKLWEEYTDASPAVIQKHREHFENRFGKYYGLPLEALTKPVLSRFRAELAQDDRFSTTTKNRTISYVRAVCRFAYNVYDVPDNSSILTRLKETEAESLQEFDVWTPDEFDRFAAAVENPLYKIYFTFLYWTGCRRGEAIALQKTEVGDHTVTIKYSQRTQTEGLKPTKKRTTRTIKLDDDLYSEMLPLLSEPGNYVFGGDGGLSPNMISVIFNRAIKTSGVKPIRLHDLRHSHATWLINNGVNIVAVSKRLGHKDVSTTLSTYTHLLDSTDNDMIKKINDFKKR